VAPYAARKGYEVAGEYVDEGVSGDEFDRLADFQRLLRDAKARRFEVVVVDEPSRLSRQDPIDFIVKVVDPLRHAGVGVDTVSSGPLDYQSLAGIILSVVHADKSASESKNISRRVLTRLVEKARKGLQPPAITPYGYKAARDSDGNRILVTGDPEEVRVVRWIYEAVADRGWTIGQVINELAARGVRPPGATARAGTRRRGCGPATPSAG
jgi:DNA invertase Pin-like site-specific DNA recombinase